MKSSPRAKDTTPCGPVLRRPTATPTNEFIANTRLLPSSALHVGNAVASPHVPSPPLLLFQPLNLDRMGEDQLDPSRDPLDVTQEVSRLRRRRRRRGAGVRLLVAWLRRGVPSFLTTGVTVGLSFANLVQVRLMGADMVLLSVYLMLSFLLWGEGRWSQRHQHYFLFSIKRTLCHG